MNPHDPAKRPGAHLVAEVLGVNDPEDLVTLHPSASPFSALGTMVADASREVDLLQTALLDRADSARKALDRLTRGADTDLRYSSSVLGIDGSSIELLAARRSEAYRHLDRGVNAYRRSLLQSATSTPLATAALSRSASTATSPAPAPTVAPTAPVAKATRSR